MPDDELSPSFHSKHRLLTNWPVVYTLNNDSAIYVGESINVHKRMTDHMKNEGKADLTDMQIILDESFNKSACLDLESFLIRLFGGDAKFEVLNANAGITERDYYDRERYQERFDEIFNELKNLGYFTRPIKEIVNSEVFKFSPFKALNSAQGSAVEDIVEGFLDDLENPSPAGCNTMVVSGDPGTGKTIVAIYLIKLLVDIRDGRTDIDDDHMFADFFVEGNAELLRDLKIGFVVPQSSLRKTLERVFSMTPGLDKSMVMSAYEAGRSASKFDLLVVEEAHRLTLRAHLMGSQWSEFDKLSEKFPNRNGETSTQLDWLEGNAKHVLLILDRNQAIRSRDIPIEVVDRTIEQAANRNRLYRLETQMRVKSGADLVGYIRKVIHGEHPAPIDIGPYDLRFFESFSAMVSEIYKREEERGLARLVAGFAWPWSSKNDKNAIDIEIDGIGLQWNTVAIDWISSANSAREVGSIHTVQGYDLNYAGVIIGPDLYYDKADGRIKFSRSNYFDSGKKNAPKVGVSFTDEEFLRFVQNSYHVLLTRGILGTYIYVVNDDLRDYLRPFFTEGIIRDQEARD